MKTIILIAIIAAVAAPIYADDAAVEPKKQEKRGVLGLGYNGYYSGLGYGGLGGLGGYGGYGGYGSYGGYGGYGHVASPVLSHGVLPTTYSHGPAVSYSNLGAYHGSPVYSAPLRLGYSGLGLGHAGLGLGHGYNGLW